MVRAIKGFVEHEGRGKLPLSGTIPGKWVGVLLFGLIGMVELLYGMSVDTDIAHQPNTLTPDRPQTWPPPRRTTRRCRPSTASRGRRTAGPCSSGACVRTRLVVVMYDIYMCTNRAPAGF